MTDYISRADAMRIVHSAIKAEIPFAIVADLIKGLPSAEPTEDYSDLPDIPRAYYEKIVGNMSHEINVLKQQLEDRPTHERDLISRHEALMELNGACEMWEDDAIVADIIHKLPSIEIVRCKDCRHGWYDDDIEYYTCRHPKGLNEELYGVDFCSYGERREP